MSAAERIALSKRKQLAEKLWGRADELTDSGKYARGFRLCKKAAHMGNESAQILLGNLYSGGAWVPYNRQAALRWYRRAYRNGYQAMAANNIGCVMRDHERYADALHWFQVAIGYGDLEPHLQIAKCF